MKILHLSYSDRRGGAAIGAYRLHRALVEHGIQSEMLVIDKITDDPSVKVALQSDQVAFQKFANRQSLDMKELYGIAGLPIRSFNLYGNDFTDLINDSDCDIVHFHWIAGNTIRIQDIAKITKPIIWKMPDMWPFSGAEHYINHFDTKRYQLGYDGTEPSMPYEVDLDRTIWEIKRKSFDQLNLTVTSPSRFLAKCAHESVLMSDYDAHVIPNPLPDELLAAERVTSQQRLEMRARWGLPADKFICAFSAFSTAEIRKGYHHFEAALQQHLPTRVAPDRIDFVVVGGSSRRVDKVGAYTVHHIPRIDDLDTYIKLFQGIDLFLCASEMDSTAMVVQEANALGVPSVIFDVGGLPELVRHKRNGYVAEPYDAEQLAEGIRWIVNEAVIEELGDYGRQLANAMHDRFACASRYLTVYQNALRRYESGDDFKTSQLFDRVTETDNPNADLPNVYLIDPSVVSNDDTSHNTEVAGAFSASFAANGFNVEWIVNRNASVSNPFGPTWKVLPYTAYDAVRASKDKRTDGPTSTFSPFEDSDYPPEREAFDAIRSAFKNHDFSPTDIVFVPMVDRILLDALIAFFAIEFTHNRPKLFLNFMFEKGNFLTGGYPLEEMCARLRATKGLGAWIFPCVETTSMARTLQPYFRFMPLVVRPPHLFDPAFVEEECRARYRHELDATGAAAAFAGQRTTSNDQLQNGRHALKSDDEIWIGSLGRGRRDKGWARLPAIIKAFNEKNGQSNVKFVVQKPRAMDNLDAELSSMKEIGNVVLLDELISNEELELATQSCDAFLLPYDRYVYGNRGSAFIWRAVALEKPFVVSEKTGLEEGLLYRNGFAAGTDADFADKLSLLVDNLDAMTANTKRAKSRYFDAVVGWDNPLIQQANGRNFSKANLVCAVGTAEWFFDLPGDYFGQSPVVELEILTENRQSDATGFKGAMFGIQWKPDFSTEAIGMLPRLVKSCLQNCSFDKIVVQDELMGIAPIKKVLSEYDRQGKRIVAASEYSRRHNFQDTPRQNELAIALLGNLSSLVEGVSEKLKPLLARVLINRQVLGMGSSVSTKDDLNLYLQQFSSFSDEEWDKLEVDDAERQLLLRMASIEQFATGAVLEVQEGNIRTRRDSTFGIELVSQDGADNGSASIAFVSGYLPIGKATEMDLKVEAASLKGDPNVRVGTGGLFSIFLHLGGRTKKSFCLRIDEQFKKFGNIEIADAMLLRPDIPALQSAEAGPIAILNAKDIGGASGASVREINVALDTGQVSPFGARLFVSGEGDEKDANELLVQLNGAYQPSAFVKLGQQKWRHEFYIDQKRLSARTSPNLTIKGRGVAAIVDISWQPVPPLPQADVRGGETSLLTFVCANRVWSEKPRSRYARWHFKLEEVQSRSSHFSKVAFYFVIYDGRPFLEFTSVEKEVVTTDADQGGMDPDSTPQIHTEEQLFGANIRYLPHRPNMYDDGLLALGNELMELIDAVAHSLVEIIKSSDVNPLDAEMLLSYADEYLDSLKRWPLFLTGESRSV